MNKRDELDAMYVIIRKGCTGKICSMCPGNDYDHCGDYNKAVMLYDAGWRKPIEAEWIPIDKYLETLKCYAVIGYTCSSCKTKVQEYTNYCAHCGAHMEVRDKL